MNVPGAHYNFPRVHNAMWPGLVGKGPDSEPPIGLDTMLRMTAALPFGINSGGTVTGSLRAFVLVQDAMGNLFEWE
jgi:hypothetical protein